MTGPNPGLAGSLDDPMLMHNLPAQATSFVGRTSEIGEIRELLLRSRLVTLTGPGGVGKTRLAVQTAAEMLDGSGSGVWLAELAGLSDPGLVVSAVAAAAGVQEAPNRPVLDTLVAALRTKELLVILDNCEHVISACMSLADTVMRACSKVHVLATSREPLGVAGEHVYRVPSLSLPTESELAAGETGLLGCESIRLFLDRALAHQPAFRLEPGTAAAVASVCRQLDGIPLAIELAAARLRSLSIADIERRLDDRFKLLTGGYRSALPRHQTLRALIDWSYDLLGETERGVLCRVSAFVGSFDLAAAEQVASADDVRPDEILDVIAALVDKSLIQLEPAGPSVRYRLLETVRRYAAERLCERGSDDEQATRDRHATVFLRLAESAAQHLGGPQEDGWRDRLETDNANLSASFHYLAGRPDRGDDLLKLAETLYRYSVTRGAISEHLGMLRLALDHSAAQQPTAARARALLATASALVRVGGSRREGLELQRASLKIARSLAEPGLAEPGLAEPSLAEPGLTASILASLSGNIVMLDDSPAAAAEALELAEEAVLLNRSTGSPGELARALKARAAVHSFAERYEQACRDGAEAAGLFLATDARKWLSRTLNNLASDEIALDRLDAAQQHLQTALPYAAEGSDTQNLSYVLGNLALVYLLRGEPAAARGPALEALKNISTDEKRVLLSSVLYLALCYAALGEPGTAAVLHGVVYGMEASLEPLDRRLRDADCHRLASLLGAEAFEVSLGQGRALQSADQVLSFLLTGSGSADQARQAPPGLGKLSGREQQLVTLVAQGHTDAQIAGQLYISVRTVHSHLDRIRDKTGCRRRADMTRLALQSGLIGGPD
jgi:predicted ATPase/DNA-binding CsgD family transcriptional regulator